MVYSKYNMGLWDNSFTKWPNFFSIGLYYASISVCMKSFHNIISVDEAEGVSKFLSDTTAQWKNLALEVRSVRSMLEEVICNWEKYSSNVAALQAWLEEAEQMVNQSENAKRVSTFSTEHKNMVN